MGDTKGRGSLRERIIYGWELHSRAQRRGSASEKLLLVLCSCTKTPKTKVQPSSKTRQIHGWCKYLQLTSGPKGCQTPNYTLAPKRSP